MWPATEAFNRADIAADWPTAVARPGLGGHRRPARGDPGRRRRRPPSASGSARRGTAGRASATSRWPTSRSIDDLPTQGAVYTDEIIDAAAAGDLMARRRLEDERFAYFAEASIVFLDLPDAVFRGYEGDDELLGMPRADDDAPFELLRQEIARLEPQKVYLPLGVGGHVDHQLCREVGIRLLQEGRRWVMPGPEYAGIVDVLRGLPVRLVERLQEPRRPAASTRWRACPADVEHHARVRRHHRPARAQDHGHQPLREPDRAAVRRARARWPTPSAGTASRWPVSVASTGPPSGTGPPTASDPTGPAPRRRTAGRRPYIVAAGSRASSAGSLIRLRPAADARASPATSTSSSCGSTASRSTGSARPTTRTCPSRR